MSLTPTASGFAYVFSAMASPCEIHVDTREHTLALRLGQLAEGEARRIEAKYSRYREDSALSAINSSAGRPIAVDEETAGLLDYADQCWRLSNGMFDITSGVLRRIWKFDGSDRIPNESQIAAITPLIGWPKVTWARPCITLRPGMEIDFGGVAKEYAVDRALAIAREITKTPLLVNFGGDLCASGPRGDGSRWKIAIEAVDRSGGMEGLLELSHGALATSGDARRFLLKDGIRYGHILTPKTGWPIERAPRSVTVAAATCLEAGMTSTIAILQGRHAERFLKREGVRAWCIR